MPLPARASLPERRRRPPKKPAESLLLLLLMISVLITVVSCFVTRYPASSVFASILEPQTSQTR